MGHYIPDFTLLKQKRKKLTSMQRLKILYSSILTNNYKIIALSEISTNFDLSIPRWKCALCGNYGTYKSKTTSVATNRNDQSLKLSQRFDCSNFSINSMSLSLALTLSIIIFNGAAEKTRTQTRKSEGSVSCRCKFRKYSYV